MCNQLAVDIHMCEPLEERVALDSWLDVLKVGCTLP